MHLCWSMLCTLLMASCLIHSKYFGDCVLLEISHPFQALDGSNICRKLMKVCVKLPLPMYRDLHRNRHSNIFQWAETWENQTGPFSSTIVGCRQQAHPSPWPQRGHRHHLWVNCGYVKGWWLYSNFALGCNSSPNALRGELEGKQDISPMLNLCWATRGIASVISPAGQVTFLGACGGMVLISREDGGDKPGAALQGHFPPPASWQGKWSKPGKLKSWSYINKNGCFKEQIRNRSFSSSTHLF